MLASVTRMLGSAKRRAQHVPVVVVHPDHAGIDGADGAVGLQLVLGVDDGCQTVVGGVGYANCIFECGEGCHGYWETVSLLLARVRFSK